ncbi:hypothetical protein Tco_1345180 [Tanacetum coccineum]
MNEQSHYKQDKTKTRQSINVKSHIFNVIGSTEEFEERDLNIGGDNMEMEPDIKNITISEYLEYEAAKERRLWDDVRSRRSSTNYNEADVDSFHQNKRAENIKRMGQHIVQDSIWEQDDDSEEDQEEDGDDGDTFDMWDITVEDVERIRDEILNVTMVDDEADFKPTKDLEELERLLTKEPQSYALSWKPCQGVSLNLPGSPAIDDGVTALFQAKSDS